jgi:triphosphatase
MTAADRPGSSETELKFQLGQSAIQALNSHAVLAGAGPSQRLRSIYFDTPEHDLRNGGFSLRVREKDGRFVQTLKSRIGAGVFDRAEWEAPVDLFAPNPALLADTPAAAILNGSIDRLSAVFETCVDRTVRVWRDGEAAVEVAIDEGEVIAADQRTPVRELELELLDGQPSALFDLATLLARETPMTLSFQSKAERGYRLAGHDGAAAIRAYRASISAKTPVEAAFRQVARECLGQIAGNAELMIQAPSATAVHQTRVGLRRLRAALAIFRPILDGPGLSRAQAETRWLAGELEAARNIDVFAERFFGGADDGAIDDPSLAALYQRVVQAQAKAHASAAKAVQSARFAALLLDLSRWVEVGDWNYAEATADARAGRVDRFGSDRLGHLRRRVRKLGRDLPEGDAAARHRLRLKVKKLRYASEFFGGAFKATAARGRYVEATKALQERLGELNDLAVARATVLQIVGPRASELAFTGALLVSAGRADEPKQLARAQKAHATLADLAPFWR